MSLTHLTALFSPLSVELPSIDWNAPSTQEQLATACTVLKLPVPPVLESQELFIGSMLVSTDTDADVDAVYGREGGADAWSMLARYAANVVSPYGNQKQVH